MLRAEQQKEARRIMNEVEKAKKERHILLSRVREDGGMTQRELAGAADVNFATIRNCEGRVAKLSTIFEVYSHVKLSPEDKMQLGLVYMVEKSEGKISFEDINQLGTKKGVGKLANKKNERIEKVLSILNGLPPSQSEIVVNFLLEIEHDNSPIEILKAWMIQKGWEPSWGSVK